MSSSNAPQRIAVLVTGMHRNGTSALARTLSLLGAALPDDLVAPNEGNPQGHWEPRGMVDLNDRMLADAGSDLYSAVDIDAAWFAMPKAEAFVAEAAQLIARSFSREPLVVLKDPRTALLLPIWNEALARCGYRVVHVLPLRHPVDVAASLRRRHLKTIPYDAWAPPRGEAVWLRYTLAAVLGSRDHGRAFLRYGDLLQDWRREVHRIGQDLGIAWPRLGTEAEAEVDAFLHGNAQADGGHSPLETAGDDLGTLDVVRLAATLYNVLVSQGDDRPRIDAMAAERNGRLGTSRDLILMLEALYPVVWRYYEAAGIAQRGLDASLAAEGQIREIHRQSWAALTHANNDKLVLQQDLASRDRQVASLRGEIGRLEQAVRASGDETARWLSEIARRDQDILGLHAHRTRIEAEHVEHSAALRQAAEAAQVAWIEGEARIAALQGSTSWRFTAPLRAISRAIRGRP